MPGTVIFPTDEVAPDNEIEFSEEFNPTASYQKPIERVVQNELKGGVKITEGPYLLEARYRSGIRGHESTVMHWAGVETEGGQEPPVGRFFEAKDISKTPPREGLIVGHAGLVERAANAYERHQEHKVFPN